MSRIEAKALPIRRFDMRPIGRKVELRISRRYADARLSQLEEELNSILSQIPGLENLTLEIAPKDGWVAFRFNDGEWANIIPLDDLKGGKGEDGKEVSISIDGFILKWRLGTGPWVNLIDLSTLGYFKRSDLSDEHFEETEEGKIKPKIDDTVTEGSENAVKSSGIWAFVTTQIDAVKNWATNLFLKKSDEDKGSAAVEGHEQEYNHNAFLTSVPPIPSDISDLTDTQDIIPPHLFFDDQYFSGAGTEVDPKSLRTENLPSGGGGAVVNTYAFTTTDKLRGFTLTKFDGNVDFEMNDGDVLAISYNYNLISNTTGEGVQGIVYLRLGDGLVDLYREALDYNQSTHQGAIVLQRVGNTLLCVYYRTNSSYDSIVGYIVFNFDFDSLNTIYIGTGANNLRFAAGGKFYFTKK